MTMTLGDFPVGSAVKNLPCNAWDTGLIPGQGTKIPHDSKQLSPRTAAHKFMSQEGIRAPPRESVRRHEGVCAPPRRHLCAAMKDTARQDETPHSTPKT